MTSTVLNRFNRSVQQLDRGFIAIALIIVVLAIFVPTQVSNSLGFTIRNLVLVSPFLLLSIGIAAYSQASDADNLIAKAFQDRITAMIAVFALARRPVFLAYLGFAFIGSITAGLAYSVLF